MGEGGQVQGSQPPLREQAIRTAFQDIDRKVLQPSAHLNTGKPVYVTNCQGREVHCIVFDSTTEEDFRGFRHPLH